MHKYHNNNPINLETLRDPQIVHDCAILSLGFAQLEYCSTLAPTTSRNTTYLTTSPKTLLPCTRAGCFVCGGWIGANGASQRKIADVSDCATPCMQASFASPGVCDP